MTKNPHDSVVHPSGPYRQGRREPRTTTAIRPALAGGWRVLHRPVDV
jgi:hypothetical protein